MSGGMVEVEPPIIAITGGRDRVPRLSELEVFEKLLPDARIVLRHGKARGTDQFVGSWARARCSYCTVEEWPADTKLYGPWPRAGHVRNHAMLVGKPGHELVSRGSASRLIAFAGGRGTANCVANAGKLGIPVSHIVPAVEPQILNRHHYPKEHDIPRPWTYVGRGTPLGNPFTVQEHGQQALSLYRRWLWDQMKAKDHAVLDALEQVTPEHSLVCSCWPRPCHAEVIVKAWKYLRSPKEVTSGDIFAAKVEAIVNPVNCVGVMGKGLAAEFKQRFPGNFEAYHQAYVRGDLQPGSMLVYPAAEPLRFIINFPTKRDWRDWSRLEDIESGLVALVREVQERKIASIAIPALGCGLGGLDWSDVQRLIASAFSATSTRVVLFGPR